MTRWTAIFAMMTGALFAQVPTAELTGAITDPTGALVAGAKVVIANTATGVERVTETNSAGVYIAPALPPGTYSVRVTASGFRSAQNNAVQLQVAQTARLNIQLEVGNVSETVEVAANTDVLDTETTTVGTVIENRRIVELPLNGRNYLQLANLVPGGTIEAYRATAPVTCGVAIEVPL